MSAGRWWATATPPPARVGAAEKFAVIEPVVSRPHRGRGVGRPLIDRLLEGRTETYGTLASVPAAPAHAMYLRWGWVKVAEFWDEEPFMDALVLPL